MNLSPPHLSFASRVTCGLLLAGLGYAPAAQAQLDASDASAPPYDPARLVEDVLLGNGVEILDVTFDGDATAIGYFENGAASVGLDRGIVLTTGGVEQRLDGEVTLTDAAVEDASVDVPDNADTRNLDALYGTNVPTVLSEIRDAQRLRIRFRPSGNSLRLRYVFASEDYNQFVCGPEWDPFGMFLSGPGIAGPFVDGAENIALVPGSTLPVNIHTINSGSTVPPFDDDDCLSPDRSLGNAAYYVDRTSATAPHVFNGQTVVLEAVASVSPCEEYVLSIEIGDGFNGNFDSGVFVEAESFDAAVRTLELVTDSPDGTVGEGCGTGRFVFGLTEPSSTDQVVNFTVGGSATPDVDYPALPTSVTIPAGDLEASIDLTAVEDSLPEGPESVSVQVALDACNTTTVIARIADSRIAPSPYAFDTTVCSGEPAPLDATLAVATDPQLTFESTEIQSDINPAPSNDIADPAATYTSELDVSGVSLAALRRGALVQVCIDVVHDATEDLDIFLYAPGGTAVELTTDNGGPAPGGYSQTCFTTAAAASVTDPAGAPPYDGKYRPEGDLDALWRRGEPANGTWRLQIRDDDVANAGAFDSWSLTFASAYDLAYDWSPAAGLSCTDCPDPVASPTVPTDYTVVITDSYGCFTAGTARVDHYGPPAAPVVTCAPGRGEVRFAWPRDTFATRYEVHHEGVTYDVGLDTFFLVDGLVDGETEDVEVTVVTRCGRTMTPYSCTSVECFPYATAATVVNASCGGYADGRIEASAAGSYPPYRYTLDTVTNGTGVFENLPAGTYTVTVLDTFDCASQVTRTVGEPAVMQTSVTVAEPATCGDPATAMATVTSGSVGAVSYAWSDGQTGPSAQYFVGGTYYVTAEDANGCQVVDSAQVAMVEPFDASFGATDVACAGDDDGTASAFPAGGRLPYSYTLNSAPVPAATTGGLAPGSYVLRVADAIGCSRDTSFTITEPPALVVVPIGRGVSCNGDLDGVATAKVSGGTPPYDFAWDDGRALDTLENLAPGSYGLIVSDARGCSEPVSVVIDEPAVLTVALVADSVLCNGTATGRMTATPTGGTPPYTYAWSTGAITTTRVLDDLTAGVYGVGVTDSRGCETSGSVTVAEPEPLRVGGVTQPLACATDDDGAITLSVSGGTTDYRYLWNDGATARDRVDMGAGTYEVLVTDVNGCERGDTFVIAAPPVLQLNATVRDVSCFGFGDGAILVQLSGGSGGDYRYTWSGPNGYFYTEPNPNGLAPGAYALSYRDGLGCVRDTAFDIAEPQPLTLATAFADTVCHAAGNGRAWTLVAGGTQPYSYFWANGERTDTAVALLGGEHVVTVTDANACEVPGSVVIPELEPLVVELDQDPVRCYGDSNGVARVVRLTYGTRTSPTSRFAYDWDGYPAASGPVLGGLGGRQFAIVTAADARGCLGTGNVVIGEPDELVAAGQKLSDVSCYDGADGAAAATARGGVVPYRFQWDNSGRSGPEVADLPAGRQIVTVTDANGCLDSAAVALVEPDSISVAVTMTEVNCFSPFSGTVDLELAGGTAPYTYAWPDGRANRYVDALAEGAYVIDLTDANGCRRDVTAVVTTAAPVAVSGEVSEVSCAGDRDGELALAATGGNGPYLYAVDDSPFTGVPQFRYLAPGDYAAVAKDRDGCLSDSLTLTIPEPDTFRLAVPEEVSVELGDQVPVAAAVTGAVGAVEYRWLPDDPALFSCLDCAEPVLTPYYEGLVSVYAVDGNGCDGEGTTRVRIAKTLRVAVPTGFTPNADGTDDILLVHGKTGTRVVNFEVYDRYGERVWADGDYSVNDVSRGWDGTFRGAAAPSGTYVWRAEVLYLDGVAEGVSGQTVLVR